MEHMMNVLLRRTSRTLKTSGAFLWQNFIDSPSGCSRSPQWTLQSELVSVLMMQNISNECHYARVNDIITNGIGGG